MEYTIAIYNSKTSWKPLVEPTGMKTSCGPETELDFYEKVPAPDNGLIINGSC